MTSAADEPVDRCVCANVTFRMMKSHVDQHGGDVDSLRAAFNCGAGCAMCMPYVRAMLATGRVRFAVNDPATRQAPASPPAPPNPPTPPLPPSL